MRKVLRFRQAWRRVQKHGNSLHLTKIKGFFRPDRNISLHIHHFYMDHNNPFFSPKILHNHCFQFLLGITVVAKEIEDNGYAKFWGLNKVHYGLCENGEISLFRLLCSKNIPRKLRGGQLGQEEGRRKFSRKDRRAHGMLILTNQFHNLFEYLSVIGHKK